MAAAGDWCHFSQRVERTSQHRQLKGGALGYEDEKFSYLIAAKSTVLSKGARIVRHPGKHSGHVQLALCTAEGKLENHTVTRSSKEAYKRARKAATECRTDNYFPANVHSCPSSEMIAR
jgi:ribosomal protein RSM22 (predicted rRNA methylase)